MAKGGQMEACPVCGAIYAKVESAMSAQPARTITGVSRDKKQDQANSNRAFVLWLLVGLAALYSVGSKVRDSMDPQVESDISAEPNVPAPRQVLDISPSEMIAGYRANEVRQDSSMEGRLVRVSGRVKSIKKDAFGGMMIRVSIPNDDEDMVINAADDQEAKVSALSIGSETLAVCDHFSFILGGPVGYKCLIVR
jgi:hypothetical protein